MGVVGAVAAHGAGTRSPQHLARSTPRASHTAPAIASSRGWRSASRSSPGRPTPGSRPTRRAIRGAEPSRSSPTRPPSSWPAPSPPTASASMRGAGPCCGRRACAPTSSDRPIASTPPWRPSPACMPCEGRRFAPGDPREGVIVVPSAALPAVPYRRGPAPRRFRTALLLLRVRRPGVRTARARRVRARARREAQGHAVVQREGRRRRARGTPDEGMEGPTRDAMSPTMAERKRSRRRG